jgi:Secretion system C-terminal sorting domain/Beta-propeller repeat
MKPILLLILIANVFGSVAKGLPDKLSTSDKKQFFIENAGQVTDQNRHYRPDIDFCMTTSAGVNIFIGPGTISYQFSKNRKITDQGRERQSTKFPSTTEDSIFVNRIDVSLAGANKYATLKKEHLLPYYENYFTAGTGTAGVTAHSFSKITYKNVYPNIDWVLSIKDEKLKQEFIVHEGGNTSDIQLRYEGTTSLTLDDKGNCISTTSLGSISEQSPVSYQADNAPIATKYVINGNTVSYQTAPFKGTLTIDPFLIWATYFGDVNNDDCYGTASDPSGNVFITGATFSLRAIATSGAYQTTISGDDDAFLSKFSSAGGLLWSTYYGGNDYDQGYAVATDASGSVIMTGSTASTTGLGPISGTFGGATDVFVAKFNSSGAIQWASYLGGANEESGYAVATDASGNVYLSGFSSSAYGFATGSAYQAVSGGLDDALIAKYSSSGVLQWATFYGGSNSDRAYGIAVGLSGNIYVSGYAESSNSIATPGTYQDTLSGGKDAFIAKFSNAGGLIWASYLGGSATDIAYGASSDTLGHIAITGVTGSAGMAFGASPYRDTLNGLSDAFVALFNESGTPYWSSYFGGNANDQANGIAFDKTGNVSITGYTTSTSSLTTAGAYDTIINGEDAFIAKFTNSGTIVTATYYGGNGNDEAYAISADPAENFFIAGATTSSTGIATSGAYDRSYAGDDDGFLAKFHLCALPVLGELSGPNSVCVGQYIFLSDSSGGGTWSVSNPTAATHLDTIRGVSYGSDTVLYTISNACGPISTTYAINVDSLPDAGAITGKDTACIGDTTILTDTIAGGTWAVLNNSKATISGGAVYGLLAGKDTVTYTVSSGCSKTVQKIITIANCRVGVNALTQLSGTGSLFPNPAHDVVTIKAEYALGEIAIYNEIGQKMISIHTSEKQLTIPLHYLASGIYCVRISNGEVLRFVKE